MIELQDVNWTLENGKQVLKDINFTFQSHRLSVITGPNGSGKTSLGKAIMGLLSISSGKIFLNGEDISGYDVTKRSDKGISYGFQQPITIKGMKIERLLRIAAGRPMTDKQLCILLEEVGLEGKKYLHREVSNTLSGGEMKRIEIATILARDSDVMIFDEPEAGIDLWSFEKLVDILKGMQHDKNKTIIVISHQERILQIADEIVLLEDGCIVDHGPGPVMMSKMMARGGKR